MSNIQEKNKYFIEEILQTTISCRRQIDLQIEKKIIANRDVLEEQLNNIFGQVTYNWKMKVRNSALKGKHHANLFFLNKPDESDLFFIKNELYAKAGLEPPFLQLERFFSQFGFEFKLVRKNGVLVAQVNWEKYFDENENPQIEESN